MKKNNFKKIFVVFSLCVFLLSLFSVSSFAMNISDVNGGFLYKFSCVRPLDACPAKTNITVKGFLVDKETGEMSSFDYLEYGCQDTGSGKAYYLTAYSGSSGSILFYFVIFCSFVFCSILF